MKILVLLLAMLITLSVNAAQFNSVEKERLQLVRNSLNDSLLILQDLRKELESLSTTYFFTAFYKTEERQKLKEQSCDFIYGALSAVNGNFSVMTENSEILDKIEMKPDHKKQLDHIVGQYTENSEILFNECLNIPRATNYSRKVVLDFSHMTALLNKYISTIIYKR